MLFFGSSLSSLYVELDNSDAKRLEMRKIKLIKKNHLFVCLIKRLYFLDLLFVFAAGFQAVYRFDDRSCSSFYYLWYICHANQKNWSFLWSFSICFFLTGYQVSFWFTQQNVNIQAYFNIIHTHSQNMPLAFDNRPKNQTGDGF